MCSAPKDLAPIRAKRRSGNRLGFAVQLCLLRHPGQGLDFGEHPPEAMIAFEVDAFASIGFALPVQRLMLAVFSV